MNFNIITLGCKVNQYESQAMEEMLLKNGYFRSENPERADITVIN
ncbi:MAG: tRNA (N(6)-L-threonylcarbamoyladenosine(37)-C(2))-methylthiotransferase MtaB, partial [bacterium]|nr:tRNA (N(6)-L-threonylcarbamoyladenosine(37)-C(2))-methylthiotransferase MtaB [bacterium]